MCSISVVYFILWRLQSDWTWSRWRSQKQGLKSLNPTTCHLHWLQNVFGGRSPTKNASLHRWWWLHHRCLSLRSFLSCGVSQSGSGTGQGIQVHQKSIGKIMFCLIPGTMIQSDEIDHHIFLSRLTLPTRSKWIPWIYTVTDPFPYHPWDEPKYLPTCMVDVFMANQ